MLFRSVFKAFILPIFSVALSILTILAVAENPDYCEIPVTPQLIVTVDGMRIPPYGVVPAGTQVTVSCRQGYVLGDGLRNGMKTFCLRSGLFLKPFGGCFPVCNGIPEVEHGFIEDEVTVDKYGQQTRRVLCNRGYRVLRGDNRVITCSVHTNGKWTTPGPCTKVCGRLPIVVNGYIMTINGTQHNIGAVRRVICKNGYILSGSSAVVCNEEAKWQLNAQCWRTNSVRFAKRPHGHNYNHNHN